MSNEISWRDRAISVIMENYMPPFGISKRKQEKARAEMLELISALSDIDLLQYYGSVKYDIGYSDGGYSYCDNQYS